MKLWKECFDLHERGESFVVVTLVASRGSSPQDPGAKIVVTEAGLYAGTVGGGRVEAAAIKKAFSILEDPVEHSPETVIWNLQTDIGMSCGGEVTLLFEHFLLKQWPIVIFGAGHVAQALTRILNKLNCSVTCLDPREEWLSRLEEVKTILHPEPSELVKELNPKSFFLCMTMGHAYDLRILLEIAKYASESPYVGVIGSEVKAIKLRKELIDFGVEKSFVEKLKIPMGLDLGKNHPYEIAISISAQLLKIRDSI